MSITQYSAPFKRSTLVLSCGVFLAMASGCASNQINAGTDALKKQTEPVLQKAMVQQPMEVTEATRGSAAYVNAQSARILEQPVARRATSAWYGQRTIPVLSDAQLPEVFKTPFAIDFDGYKGGRVPIAVVAERLSRMSGVPVRVNQDVYSKSGSSTGVATVSRTVPTPMRAQPMPSPLPSGANRNFPMPNMAPMGAGSMGSLESSVGESAEIATTDLASVSMKWNGSLERFLDHITGMLNLSWSYRDGVVVIERYMTETFEISAFGGTQDFKMSTTGGNSGSSTGGFGSASAVLDVHETGKLAILDSLKKSLDAMVQGTGGSVTLNEGSGRFTVVAPRDVLSRVREVIKAEDAVLSRQAHIQFDIYSVTNKVNDEYGVDWSGVINDLAKTWAGTVSTPATLVSSTASNLGFTLLKTVPDDATQLVKNTAARYGGSKVNMQALHQMGESAQYRPVSFIAKNRQWTRKNNLTTIGYVSETTPSTSSAAGSGAPGQKTSVLTTGDKFAVQPAILSDGTIDLKFGISLTDLIGLFEVTAGSGSTLQRVQTPETSGTDDQGTVRLKAGEAMVITGLSRRVASSDRNGLAEEIPIVAGGSKKRSYKREDFLIVVRATPI